MMHSKLPPLNALRAFEVAGRHLSFTRAAAELHVTPAAVGHQIKALEDYLGVQLFRRLNRALLLTDAGQACLPELRDGFERLGAAVERIKRFDAKGILTISVEPSLAAKWLVRRLDRFHESHPDVDVMLDASLRLVDLRRENVDLCIRYGAGDYPGLRVDKLMADEIYPVCSPQLLSGEHPLKTVDDLRWHTLLHDDSEPDHETWPDWEMWLRAAGSNIEAHRGPRFSQPSMCVEAAMEGHGVALVSHALVDDDLTEGWLVRPFGPDVSTPLDFSYYVVCLDQVYDQPKIAAFRDWLFGEVVVPSLHIAPGTPYGRPRGRWPHF